MRYLRSHLPFLVLLMVVCIFFYQTILFGKIPFPGDLLLSEYVPWRHQSYFGYVPGTIPSKGQYFDVVRELYPWKTLAIDDLKHGELPLWNPYNFSGTPLLANYQSQVMYPLGILYFILPQVLAWTILVMAQPLLASFFMFLFTKEIGLTAAAAITAGILFGYSSFSNVWMEFNTVSHTILWLPLLLFILERAIRQKYFSFGQKILFMFALFSSITGGHPQDFINTFLFFLIYALIRLLTLETMSKKEKLSFIINPLSWIIIVPFLLAAPQIFPTIDLFRSSARVAHDVTHIVSVMLVQWWQIPMIIYQDFFGNPATRTYLILDTYVGKTVSIGVIGCFLALVSFFRKNKPWHWKFFAVTSGVMMVLTIHSPLSELLYRFPIPILSTGTPTRNLFIFLFSFAVLAGFGFDFISQKLKIKKLVIFVCIGIIACSLAAYAVIPNVVKDAVGSASMMKKSLLIISALSIATLFISLIQTRIPKMKYLIPLLIVCELGAACWKFNPFVPSSYLYPPHEVLSYLSKNAGINRFWGYGTAKMESNINAQYRLYSPDGTDPLNLSLYNRFIQSSADATIARKFTRSTRSDAALAPGWGKDDLPNNPHRLRIMDLLGVKYVLDRIDNPKDEMTFPVNRFKPVFSSNDGYTIQENMSVLPRAFLTNSIAQYTDEADFERQFFDPTFDPKETILIPESAPAFVPSKTSNKRLSIDKYGNNEVVIKTESDAPQFLFLSDSFDKGWSATIDGKPTHLYQADFAFRGVGVPVGAHEIRFTYFPQSFRNGIIVAVAGILIFGLLVFWKKKQTK